MQTLIQHVSWAGAITSSSDFCVAAKGKDSLSLLVLLSLKDEHLGFQGLLHLPWGKGLVEEQN